MKEGAFAYIFIVALSASLLVILGHIVLMGPTAFYEPNPFILYGEVVFSVGFIVFGSWRAWRKMGES